MVLFAVNIKKDAVFVGFLHTNVNPPGGIGDAYRAYLYFDQGKTEHLNEAPNIIPSSESLNLERLFASFQE